MLIDIVMVRDELDMLDLRLRTYAGIVDRFVIIEGTRTFGTGDPKPTHVADSGRFCRPDTQRVVVDDWPDGGPWARERHQRNAAAWATEEYPADTKVMFGDVDEFPGVDVVAEFTHGPTPSHPLACQHRNMVYAINLEHPDPHVGTMLATLGEMRALTPQGLRDARQGAKRIVSGFHFSWTGDLAAKAAATAHTEFADLDYQRGRDEQVCPWDGKPLRRVDIDVSWPPPLLGPRVLPDGWLA